MTLSGQCKLCSQTTTLVDSHFIPASIYKVCRDHTSNQNAIAVTRGFAKISTHEITDNVFCLECEKRLNENGESWVHLNIARPNEFLLQENLQRATPAVSNDVFVAYEGRSVPGIDVAQLGYFALSVFWRGAAHEWPLDHKGEKTERLSFGAEGAIRPKSEDKVTVQVQACH